jgi:hypothetical protein
VLADRRYFILQGDVVKVRKDLDSVSSALSSRLADRVLVLDDAVSPMPFSGIEAIRRIESKAGLRLAGEEAFTKSIFLAPLVKGRTPDVLYAVEGVASERAIFLTRVVAGVAPLPFIGAHEISWQAIESLALSMMRDPQISLANVLSQVRNEVDEKLQDLVLEHVESLLRRASQAVSGGLEGDALASASYDASSMRLSLATLRGNFMRHDRHSREMVDFMYASDVSVTGIVNALTSATALWSEQQARKDADERERQNALSTARTVGLSRLAAVFVFPGLWFAFLGANVFPSRLAGIPVDGGIALVGSVLGALVSSIFGLLIVNTIVKGSK